MRWVGGCVSVVALCGVLVGCGSSDLDAESGLERGPESGLEDSALAGGNARGSLADEQRGMLGAAGAAGPLEDIYFGYDSIDLSPEARAALQRNRDWLERNPAARVEIEGHCDDRGTIEYNLALGARRAAAAKDYLSALGVSSSRITTISYGEELPLCRESTDACWQRNRRGHFVVFE
jgi:peptidoglycan-associated lipoprotein